MDLPAARAAIVCVADRRAQALTTPIPTRTRTWRVFPPPPNQGSFWWRGIEDHWHLGWLSDGSFDELAVPITHMFDFASRRAGKLFLDRETGTPVDHAGRDG
jgi:hypothetical protein